MDAADGVTRHELPLAHVLVRLLHHYRRQGTTEAARLGYGDIKSSHLQVLAHVPTKGTRLTSLAAQAQLSLAATSEFVTELEELGYVERRADPADGRAKLIAPTARGRKAFRDGAKAAAAIERRWALLVGRERFGDAVQVLEELLGGLEDPAGVHEASTRPTRRRGTDEAPISA